MATTMTETLPAEMNYGGFADAIGGVATIVLAVVALAGVRSDIMVAIATIIFGAALLVQGGTILSEYAHAIFPVDATATSANEFGGGSLAAAFLVGAAGIVLGVLALLKIYPVELTAIAAIAFGSALAFSSKAVWHLHQLKRASLKAKDVQNWRWGSEVLAGEMASGSAGIQAMAGLAAAILGILAVVGTSNPSVLTLVALLVLGTTIVLTGSALSGAVLSFMRPPMQPSAARQIVSAP